MGFLELLSRHFSPPHFLYGIMYNYGLIKSGRRRKKCFWLSFSILAWCYLLILKAAQRTCVQLSDPDLNPIRCKERRQFGATTVQGLVKTELLLLSNPMHRLKHNTNWWATFATHSCKQEMYLYTQEAQLHQPHHEVQLIFIQLVLHDNVFLV